MSKLGKPYQTGLPDEVRDMILGRFIGAEGVSLRRYQANLGEEGYSILVGREPMMGNLEQLRWHISVAHPRHLPHWEHIVEIAHMLRPGVVFVLALPPKSWWVNLHQFTLHIHETHDQPLIDQWRHEGRGDDPT